MTNVTSIGGAHAPSPVEPVESLVAMLEDLLVDAKSGHLRQLAFAGLTDTLHVMTGIDCHAEIFNLMGAVAHLQIRLNERVPE